jgi:hypothetical protein
MTSTERRPVLLSEELLMLSTVRKDQLRRLLLAIETREKRCEAVMVALRLAKAVRKSRSSHPSALR